MRLIRENPYDFIEDDGSSKGAKNPKKKSNPEDED